MKDTEKLLIVAVILLSVALSTFIALSSSGSDNRIVVDEETQMKLVDEASSWNAAADPYWSDYN